MSIREACEEDFDFVVDLMTEALTPYYGGDHKAHAERIFRTHISGGADNIGFFSVEQKMYVAEYESGLCGMIHLVKKRQQTIKISPLIVSPKYQGHFGIGKILLNHAIAYARIQGARQVYCTVARNNERALRFFIANGFTHAGDSESHYKSGVTEAMLYKRLIENYEVENFDRVNVTVSEYSDKYYDQVRSILLAKLPVSFEGIDDDWMDRLFRGYDRRIASDVNSKYKLIFIALDRRDQVLGIAAATPKKGSPIKLMPFLAISPAGFFALVIDVPGFIRPHGRKVYAHLNPDVSETVMLQRCGWRLDGVFPEGYQKGTLTQQWSLDIDAQKKQAAPLRVKKEYLQAIIDGKKNLEVRVKYKHIQYRPGDIVPLESRELKQLVLVVDVREYSSFEDMFKQEDYKSILPGRKFDEVNNILRGIYPEEKEKLGIVVLEIELIKTSIN